MTDIPPKSKTNRNSTAVADKFSSILFVPVSTLATKYQISPHQCHEFAQDTLYKCNTPQEQHDLTKEYLSEFQRRLCYMEPCSIAISCKILS